MSYPQPTGAYEVDHFIPLEIGGSNDLTNLWLEPASPTPGFHQKDQLENFEHGQVCNGTISVAEAQSRMVSDWYLYWQEEVEGATPTTSAPVQSAPPASTTAEASPAYYTSSYHTAKYWYQRWLHNFGRRGKWNFCLTTGTLVPANQERR